MPNRRSTHAHYLNGRHPFEIYLMVASIFGGVFLFLTDEVPPSISLAVGHSWGRYIFAFFLTLGPIITIWGISGKFLRSLSVEAIGCVLTGAVYLFYAVALMLNNAQTAVVALAFTLGFGIACYSQAIKIFILLNKVGKGRRGGDNDQR